MKNPTKNPMKRSAHASKCCNAVTHPMGAESTHVCSDCKRSVDFYGFETWYGTIVRSEEWRRWEKENEKNPKFDVAESREAGILSDEHWKAFVNFIRSQKP